ncbi:hypothetical protein NG895_23400 [Aeoliella sp. ICT_H6.2]|uniref:Uncharacterized protein n=1 Tax=Aeoliella straminimaris TaxID=2954799 RepID=A0A9X2JIH9_9BACT|nr:hypothetical protein [Aeoliella straminimaris]MCO6046856.1 hypothetical protein [Aeoliella straminimaris]
MTSLSPQNEELLRKLVATGRFQSEDAALGEAIRLLVEQSEDTAASGVLPPMEWVKEFDRITASRTAGNPHMDDSRESIYGDRGL